MFIRCTTIKTAPSGKTYQSFRLVETERVNGKVKQRTLINLGRFFDVPQRNGNHYPVASTNYWRSKILYSV
jgi:hypothetical protein